MFSFVIGRLRFLLPLFLSQKKNPYPPPPQKKTQKQEYTNKNLATPTPTINTCSTFAPRPVSSVVLDWVEMYRVYCTETWSLVVDQYGVDAGDTDILILFSIPHVSHCFCDTELIGTVKWCLSLQINDMICRSFQPISLV